MDGGEILSADADDESTQETRNSAHPGIERRVLLVADGERFRENSESRAIEDGGHDEVGDEELPLESAFDGFGLVCTNEVCCEKEVMMNPTIPKADIMRG